MLIIKNNSDQILAQSESALISLGREDENTVRLDEEAISGYHGIFFRALKYWVYRDNFSTNGSYYNGNLMRAGQIKLVKDRDIIRLASFTLKCELSVKNEVDNSVIVFRGFDVVSILEIGDTPLIIDQSNVEELTPELTFTKNEMGAITLDTASSLAVNGGAHTGKMALLDQDQIDIEDFSLLVVYTNRKPVRSAIQKPTRPEEEVATRSQSNQKFIFNTEKTNSAPLLSGVRTSEMSMSQRLAWIADEEQSIKESRKESILAIFGAITLLTTFSFIVFVDSIF